MLTLLLAGTLIKVAFLRMVLDVACMIVVPLLSGFAVRHYFKKGVERILPVFPAISVTFIIFICSLVIAINKDSLIMITGVVLAAVGVLNVYGMSAGYGVGAVFGMEIKRRRTLSIEIGMQNAGLGVVLALEYFGDRAAMPAAVFVFVCIITASLMAVVWQKRAVEVVVE